MDIRLFNFHDLILSIAIGQCFLLAISRSLLASKNKLENALLIAFILIVAINGIANILHWNPELLPHGSPLWKVVVHVGMIAHIARGIALYLYVQTITRAELKLNRRLLLHTLPFLVVVLSCLVLSSEAYEAQAYQTVSYLWYFIKIVSLSYVIASGILIFNYRKNLKEGFSYFPDTEITWLYCLTTGFFISWSWSLVIGVVGDTVSWRTATAIAPIHNYIFLLVINALFIYTMLYTNQRLKVNADEDPETESEPSASVEITGMNLVKSVMSGIEEHKLHLEQNITLDEYSRRIKLSPRAVSTMLNHHKSTNFFEFINSHRVEHAKLMLASPEHRKTPIVDILSKSGFNNKSSFHRFFKRIVGIPPNEYRRNAIRRDKR